MMNEESETPSLDGYDVFVILGSKSAVYDKEVEAAWFGRELDLIGEAARRDYPGLRDLLRSPSALPVPRRRRGTLRGTGDRLVRGRGGERFGHRERSVVRVPLRSLRLPEDAQLWATSPRAVQAFRVGRNVGVQFHPEVDHLQLRDWFASGVDEAREFGVDTDALIAQTERETPAARVRAAASRRSFLVAH